MVSEFPFNTWEKIIMTQDLTMLQITSTLNYRVGKILYDVHDKLLTSLTAENDLL